MTPQELKNSILQLAIQGKLVDQRPEEGTAEELYRQIQQEKQALIKAGKIKKEKPLPEITEDEIPFEIPESWMWVRLGVLIRVIGGVSYDKKDVSNFGYRILRGGNIQQMNVLLAEDDVFLPEQYRDDDKLIREGDILVVASTGSKAVIGKAGYVDRSITNTMIGAFLRICRPYQLSIANYLRCLFDSDFYRKHIRELAQGTNINNVKESYITEFAIPLPPLAEQKRIVARIEELLPLIDRYEKAWNRLEDFNKHFPDDLQKSILQMAIQGKLVEQRPEDGTGEELYQQIQNEKQALIKAGKIKREKPVSEIAKDEIPFEIPENWEWVSVGSVCINIQYGTSNKSSISGKTVVLRMGNIQNGRIVYDKLVYTSDETEIKKYQLEVDDLLFNRTNSKELVGKTAIYKGEIPAVFAGYLVRITPLQMRSDFLNYVMQSQYYWNYCQIVRSDAIGQSNINAEKLKRFVFPLPPLAEQKRIVAKLEELLPLCERMRRLQPKT